MVYTQWHLQRRKSQRSKIAVPKVQHGDSSTLLGKRVESSGSCLGNNSRLGTENTRLLASLRNILVYTGFGLSLPGKQTLANMNCSYYPY